MGFGGSVLTDKVVQQGKCAAVSELKVSLEEVRSRKR